jgi:hypothetical protein
MTSTSPVFSSLETLLVSLVRAPVQVQEMLDRRWLGESLLHRRAISTRPPEDRGFLAALLPPPARGLVQEFELTAETRLRTERTTGLSLQARPVNLSWLVRYGRTDADEDGVPRLGWQRRRRRQRDATNRISLLIKQLPLTPEQQT